MAIIAKDPKKPRWHTIITDQKGVPEKEKFAIEYVMLDLEKDANLRDNILTATGMGDERKEQFNIGAQDKEVLEMCIMGWKNLKDDEEKDVVYDRKNIDWLPPKIREEIIRVIKGESPVSAARKKEMKDDLN